MRNYFLIAALSAGVGAAFADEQKETLKEQSGAGKVPPIEVKRDPRQDRAEPTTQIRPNSGAPGKRQQGGGAVPQNDPKTIDQDLKNRVLVSLSTGSVGTQGVIATNSLTDIKVDVKDRVVTLRGDVTTEKNREVLENRVKGLAGVDRVINELKVNPNAKIKRSGLLNPDGYSGTTSPTPK